MVLRKLVDFIVALGEGAWAPIYYGVVTILGYIVTECIK